MSVPAVPPPQPRVIRPPFEKDFGPASFIDKSKDFSFSVVNPKQVAESIVEYESETNLQHPKGVSVDSEGSTQTEASVNPDQAELPLGGPALDESLPDLLKSARSAEVSSPTAPPVPVPPSSRTLTSPGKQTPPA